MNDLERLLTEEAGLQIDVSTLELLNRVVSVQEIGPDESPDRDVVGSLASDGTVGETVHRHPTNLLRMDLGEWVHLISQAIPLTAPGLYAADSSWQKIAIAVCGLFNVLWKGSQEELDRSDAQILFAIARADKSRVPLTEIIEQYIHLFGEAPTEEHLRNSKAKLSKRGIIRTEGEAVRVREKLKLKF